MKQTQKRRNVCGRMPPCIGKRNLQLAPAMAVGDLGRRDMYVMEAVRSDARHLFSPAQRTAASSEQFGALISVLYISFTTSVTKKVKKNVLVACDDDSCFRE